MSDLDTVFDDSLPEDHRSGVVAVVGRPNVGKSTLINAVLRQKIAIVSPKPQTTRKQQLGIYTDDHAQILFVDTPGLHKPQHKLGEFMVKVAENSLRDADVILWVMDVSQPPSNADKLLAERLNELRGQTPLILALNKADLLNDATREANIEASRNLITHETYFLVSAIQGSGVDALVENIRGRLPLGPRYYPVDQVSEVNMRFLVAEVIREKIILHTEQEIPYSVAVEVESFQERSEKLSYVSAIIYVERDTQKGIIIGKGGAMIKQIGSEAREELKGMLDTDVYLDLRVKELKNWRSDDNLMRRLGYSIPKDER
jgi:GTPase